MVQKDYLKDLISQVKQKKKDEKSAGEKLAASANKGMEELDFSKAMKELDEVKAEATSPQKGKPESIKLEKQEKRQEFKKEDEEKKDSSTVLTEVDKEFESKPKKLIEKYGIVEIYEVKGDPIKLYMVPVSRPTAGERTIINTLKEAATRLVTSSPFQIKDQEQRRNIYYQKIVDILRASPELRISSNKFDFYANAVVAEMIGYGLIDNLVKDDNLEEVMVIGPKKAVYVFHRKHDMMKSNVEFFSDDEIQDVINRIAREIGRRVDISSPLLDARLPDGSRINATVPPASVAGSTLTIRKFRKDPYSMIDLLKYNTVDAEAAAFLWLCVDGLNTRPANMLISGGTSSGKTTLLNVLCSFVPETERVISIEDTAELNLPIKHWIRMESRPPGLEGKGEITLDMLTKNSLRMRPDRIIVGEVRHDEAFSLLTAMNTGHEGCMGTIHANSADETIVRLTNPPMNVPEIMLSGLNFIIVENLFHSQKKGTYRRITEIAEVVGVLDGKAKTQTVYKWDPAKDKLKRTNNSIAYLELLQDFTGSSKEGIEKEIQDRTKFLERMLKENIREMDKLAEETEKFYSKRE